jgi:putative SOS response-associated peptidase YedK
VVADGFHEWRQRQQGKQPFYIVLSSQKPFGFAGLWDTWSSADGKEIKTCTIITTEANELLNPIHDRMPVILKKEDEAMRLDPTIQDPAKLLPLLKPYPAEDMVAYPVSAKVNNPTPVGFGSLV